MEMRGWDGGTSLHVSESVRVGWCNTCSSSTIQSPGIRLTRTDPPRWRRNRVRFSTQAWRSPGICSRSSCSFHGSFAWGWMTNRADVSSFSRPLGRKSKRSVSPPPPASITKDITTQEMRLPGRKAGLGSRRPDRPIDRSRLSKGAAPRYGNPTLCRPTDPRLSWGENPHSMETVLDSRALSYHQCWSIHRGRRPCGRRHTSVLDAARHRQNCVGKKRK